MRPILKREHVSALRTILRPVALLFLLFWLVGGFSSTIQPGPNAQAYLFGMGYSYARPAIWSNAGSGTFNIVPVMTNTVPGRVDMNALRYHAGRNPLYLRGMNPNRIRSISVLAFNPRALMIYPGETSLVEVQVSNPASIALQGVLLVQPPDGWLAQVADDPRVVLQPGQYRTIAIEIGAPEWAEAQRVEIPVYLSGAGRAYGGSIIATVPYLDPSGLLTFGITGGNYLRFTSRGGSYVSDSMYVFPGATYTISMEAVGAPVQATIVESDGRGNVLGESQPVLAAQASDGWFTTSGIYIVGQNTRQLQLHVIAQGQAMVGNVRFFPVLQAPGTTPNPPEYQQPGQGAASEPASTWAPGSIRFSRLPSRIAGDQIDHQRQSVSEM